MEGAAAMSHQAFDQFAAAFLKTSGNRIPAMKPSSFVLLTAIAATVVAQAASPLHDTHATADADTSISQMADNTPAPLNGRSCLVGMPSATHSTSTSWWRRFYFGEYGSPGLAEVESVTIAVESGPPTPITINLYTIAHSDPVDTITIEHLNLIGSGSGTSSGAALQVLTIPVTGTVADAVDTDLVVEYHIDGSVGNFYAGANGTPQTHTSFMSAINCSLDEPTPTADFGEPDSGHAIFIVNLSASGPGAPNLSKKFEPASMNIDATSTLTITLGNQSQPGAATLSSDLVDTFPAGLVVAAVPNASTTCGGTATVTTSAGSDHVVLKSGAIIPAAATCAVTVDVTSATGAAYVNSMAAGALVTDLGNNVSVAKATLLVIPVGGGNGITTSGPLNHPIPDSADGTSMNIVTSAFDDDGPTDGDWDAKFFDFADEQLVGYLMPDNGGTYAVDGSGNALVLHAGDTVGPNLSFLMRHAGFSYLVPFAAAWEQGTDAYLGVRFNCDGRLTFPVPSTMCYGYVHLTTTASTGFPATIVDTAFDGDGNPITIAGGAPGNNPVATVTPAALNFSVAADATATDTLNIANAAGSDPLTFSIGAHGAMAAATQGRLISSARATKRGVRTTRADALAERAVIGARHRSDTSVLNQSDNDVIGMIDDLDPSQTGNRLIRATASGRGAGGPCTGPIVPWLTVRPPIGSVSGGDSAAVTLTADPAAAGLAAGSYDAELCITTNDPTQVQIAVPVTLTVTTAVGNPCSATDTILCDGFDGPGAGAFTQPVADPSFEATTADDGSNPDWDSLDNNDNNGADGGTVFYSRATTGPIPTRSGVFSAWFGGWAGGAETQTFSQSVVLPHTGALFLNYWRYVDVAPDVPSSMVVSVDGHAVETTDLSTLSDDDFVQQSIDIGNYADGAAHVIAFEYDYDDSGTTDGNTFIDGVTIDQESAPGKR
jgi:hypothetical protein